MNRREEEELKKIKRDEEKRTAAMAAMSMAGSTNSRERKQKVCIVVPFIQSHLQKRYTVGINVILYRKETAKKKRSVSLRRDESNLMSITCKARNSRKKRLNFINGTLYSIY